jgi:small subunit ribosomal protein S5
MTEPNTTQSPQRPAGSRPPFQGGGRQGGPGGGGDRGGNSGRVFRKGGPGGGGRFNKDKNRKKRQDDIDSSLETSVIHVRRVTRVAKGGKKMRFSALVVVGDKAGRVGFAIRKGVDFQAAVQKATKKAQTSMIKITLNEDSSLQFPIEVKYKASRIFLKPAKQGTGLIAGGFLRPVLELAGIQNIYSKIIGGTNKITGVQATFKALEKYKSN